MLIANLSLIFFLALLAWRLGFLGLRLRPLARAIGAREHAKSIIDPNLRFLWRSDTGAVANNILQNAWKGVHTGSKKERAERYLLRIVAITGAAPMGNGYVLDVGTTRFHVREGHVGRQRDMTDPGCALVETCFYLAQQSIPKAEQIATVLLQVASNPALFDKWAAQSGAFRADGQPFSRTQ
jgi:hypothetical protein